MHLADVTSLASWCRESGAGFEKFRLDRRILELGWPADVVEQWLYDHSDKGAFLRDYATVELSTIRWELEALQAVDLAVMPTGPSDGDILEEFAANPDHWISVRDSGVHVGVALSWEVHGTWKRWPVIIDRQLVDPTFEGLQVVEGRTRLGILRGRLRQGDLVAERHLAWVGRPSG